MRVRPRVLRDEVVTALAATVGPSSLLSGVLWSESTLVSILLLTFLHLDTVLDQDRVSKVIVDGLHLLSV